MKKLYRIYEFLFNRWKKEVQETGNERWNRYCPITSEVLNTFSKSFVLYKYTNKFDGSVKLKKVYLN